MIVSSMPPLGSANSAGADAGSRCASTQRDTASGGRPVELCDRFAVSLLLHFHVIFASFNEQEHRRIAVKGDPAARWAARVYVAVRVFGAGPHPNWKRCHIMRCDTFFTTV